MHHKTVEVELSMPLALYAQHRSDVVPECVVYRLHFTFPITVAVGVMRSLRLTTHHGRRYIGILLNHCS